MHGQFPAHAIGNLGHRRGRRRLDAAVHAADELPDSTDGACREHASSGPRRSGVTEVLADDDRHVLSLGLGDQCRRLAEIERKWLLDENPHAAGDGGPTGFSVPFSDVATRSAWQGTLSSASSSRPKHWPAASSTPGVARTVRTHSCPRDPMPATVTRNGIRLELAPRARSPRPRRAAGYNTGVGTWRAWAPSRPHDCRRAGGCRHRPKTRADFEGGARPRMAGARIGRHCSLG